MTEPQEGRQRFAQYLDRMASLGFRPSRKLGQNFLLDPTLHAALADAAGVTSEDLVLEVGPGLGFLTREILARGAEVLAVEVDARLVRILTEELAAMGEPGGRAQVVHADALSQGRLNPEWVDVLTKRGGEFVLAANLPYAVSGPLLAELTTLTAPPRRGAVMVQAELAERVAASPGSPEFGSLSALLQSLYAPRLVRRVGRQVFRPRPRVDSAILALTPRPDGPGWQLDGADRAAFSRFLRGAFSARRKKLRNALPAACRLAGLEPTAMAALPPEDLERRPGELSGDELLALWRCAMRLA